ncbi:MAG: NADPH dehydrogenase [Gemmatimonadaceae bacterium]|nr:NADPH dehydrogenase [Gemmatimonadaceae bacterium]
MKVAVIGGGPAGLYAALLIRKYNPTWQVAVVERNAPDDTFGWGVVFSDQTLENFLQADADSYQAILDHFAHWDDIDVHVHGRTITSSGHGFSGLGRITLLRILQQRAAALGVELRFSTNVRDETGLATLGLGDADLIIAADGVNSAVRERHASEFRPTLDNRPNRYVWFGTTRRFDAFTFAFVQTETGNYWAHAYRFDEGLSTFIVECDEASWRAAGFDRADARETSTACERLFAPWLDGHVLLYNATPHRQAAPWVTFLRVGCESWFTGNIVLLGDAAHTAHFSIGSGTKLAMEDAIALAEALSATAGTMEDPVTRPAALAAALTRYQDARMTEVLRIQSAARNSMEWFEHVGRYWHLDAEQFAYSLLTRSQRVSHENLRLRDREYLSGVERWFASRTAAANTPHSAPPPPMFTPFVLRGMTLENRIVVSPMDLYCAENGTPGDFHLVHYGARALGGAGLIVTEMTCVSPTGRITPGCAGMYVAAHTAAWKRITRFVHEWSRARIALQLGHSGRKGSVKIGLEHGDEPLSDAEAWNTLAPSAIPYLPAMRTPGAMTRSDMDRVRDEFVRAATMANTADFDMLELHCAHGYLLSSFLTPLANQRTDEYGGTTANRLRYPLEVFRAVRDVWPVARPISVRISATDWVDGGVDAAESVTIARAFAEAGADIIHVSTGQTSPDARPVYGRMWQTPFSDRIRNEVGIPTIAVGSITDPDQVNSILAAGRADLCALARPHLADPNWTLHAAARQGWRGQAWPWPYTSGSEQLQRLLERAAQAR